LNKPSDDDSDLIIQKENELTFAEKEERRIKKELMMEELEKEIRRIFSLLKGKRWICCTSHFVQKHCSVEDLTFAYELIYKLARE